MVSKCMCGVLLQQVDRLWDPESGFRTMLEQGEAYMYPFNARASCPSFGHVKDTALFGFDHSRTML